METTELLEIASRGEDSRHQFKENATNATSLAAEIVAFANGNGGQNAVRYPGNDIHAARYLDSADILGRLQTQFEETLSFVVRKLRREQNARNVNSVGQMEIPRIVLEELIANA